MEYKNVTVEAVVNAPINIVWEYYTKPEHIIKWNFASADWISPRASNDLRAGGRFSSRMESVDGTAGFDFEGTYDEVVEPNTIKYHLDDNRKVTVAMQEQESGTKVSVTFDLEEENTEELQRGGWQAILDNFKKYVEAN